jgi:hypothetical protein
MRPRRAAAAPPRPEPLHVDRAGSAALTPRDRELLGRVEAARRDGLHALDWWRRGGGARCRRFELVRGFNRADSSFGFFDDLPLAGCAVPVMGVVQDLAFDRSKGAESGELCAQLREFVLRYFLRVSDWRAPVASMPAAAPPPETFPLGLSWCPPSDEGKRGFGYSQRYYKLRGSGRVGKFPAEQRSAIVDLREVGSTYEWIVLSVRIFDFELAWKPAGESSPYLAVPLQEESLVVLSPELIRCEEAPAPGVLGRYSLGYLLLRDPLEEGLLAYGPGRFDLGFQQIEFTAQGDGEIRTRFTFVVNRPQRILNLSTRALGQGLRLFESLSLGLSAPLVAPFERALGRQMSGFDPLLSIVALANVCTGGFAGRDLCISKEALEKSMLVQHFRQHYTLLTGCLMTWRRVADWRDTAALPDWVVRGEEAP